MEAVAIRGLTKTYSNSSGGVLVALDAVDLSIPQGSLCALLGPNGAGKSTMIGILAGNVVKSSGNVKVMGCDLDQDSKGIRRLIGVVPQRLIADIYFPVRRFLEIYAGYYGIRSPGARIDRLLETIGLKDRANSLPRELSGGMMRRFLIAKALVHEPPVVILDEPTVGVDIALRDQIWAYLREINKSGVTILITTHYLQEAEELCNLFVFINDGKILASKGKRELEEGFANKKALVLRLSEPLSEVPAALAEYKPKLTSGNSLTFNCSGSCIDGILKATYSAGIGIADIETHQIDLEDLFRSLIFGKVIS